MHRFSNPVILWSMINKDDVSTTQALKVMRALIQSFYIISHKKEKYSQTRFNKIEFSEMKKHFDTHFLLVSLLIKTCNLSACLYILIYRLYLSIDISNGVLTGFSWSEKFIKSLSNVLDNQLCLCVCCCWFSVEQLSLHQQLKK